VLGAVHKRRPHSEERGGCKFWTFADKGGGVSRMRMSFFTAKIYRVSEANKAQEPDFVNRMKYVRADKGEGVSQCTFCRNGRRAIFCIFVWTSLMNSPLPLPPKTG